MLGSSHTTIKTCPDLIAAALLVPPTFYFTLQHDDVRRALFLNACECSCVCTTIHHTQWFTVTPHMLCPATLNPSRHSFTAIASITIPSPSFPFLLRTSVCTSVPLSANSCLGAEKTVDPRHLPSPIQSSSKPLSRHPPAQTPQSCRGLRIPAAYLLPVRVSEKNIPNIIITTTRLRHDFGARPSCPKSTRLN